MSSGAPAAATSRRWNRLGPTVGARWNSLLRLRNTRYERIRTNELAMR